jgi:hypothetical protein
VATFRAPVYTGPCDCGRGAYVAFVPGTPHEAHGATPEEAAEALGEVVQRALAEHDPEATAALVPAADRGGVN